jgi:hypothetical protein
LDRGGGLVHAAGNGAVIQLPFLKQFTALRLIHDIAGEQFLLRDFEVFSSKIQRNIPTGTVL